MLNLPLLVSSSYQIFVTSCSTQLTTILFNRARTDFHFHLYLKPSIQINVVHNQYIGKCPVLSFLTVFENLFKQLTLLLRWVGRTRRREAGVPKNHQSNFIGFSPKQIRRSSEMCRTALNTQGTSLHCSSHLQLRNSNGNGLHPVYGTNCVFILCMVYHLPEQQQCSRFGSQISRISVYTVRKCLYAILKIKK